MSISESSLRSSPLPIEDYALIGDCRTAALVAKDGSIDWLCLPRFDSPACFSALLGTSDNGCWLISPCQAETRIKRHYWKNTLILETIFTTESGEVALIDTMPLDKESSHIIRRVEGRRGRVPMQLHLRIRFNYGLSRPWVTREEDGKRIIAIVGPDLIVLRSPIPIEKAKDAGAAQFDIEEGQNLTFVLSHGPSHLPAPDAIDGDAEIRATQKLWQGWSEHCRYDGPAQEAVMTSLLVLKALTYKPTGGIVASPTTSLPEQPGGVRNWDYRFCWLRDATLTLTALMGSGYFDEAQTWRDWLHRSIAGNADQIQTMYGVSGERKLLEWEVDHLPGYQNARPVRAGNAASEQLQLDTYGEVMDALHQARHGGLEVPPSAWELQLNMLEHLEKIWRQPDNGIWEMRGEKRHFVHSKVMVWVAFDRAIQDAEDFGLAGAKEHWEKICGQIHAEVCAKGFNKDKNSFTQSYGSEELDASLLLIPIVGFLTADDPHVRGTLAAVEKELLIDGLVLRYRTASCVDGLPSGEGRFLPCSFWLADNYMLQGRHAEAEALFRRLLDLRNDVGLLSEEYDLTQKRLVGNFPQAFSHLSLVNTALNLYMRKNASHRRRGARRQTC